MAQSMDVVSLANKDQADLNLINFLVYFKSLEIAVSPTVG